MIKKKTEKKEKMNKYFFSKLLKEKEKKYGVVIAYEWALSMEDFYEIN